MAQNDNRYLLKVDRHNGGIAEDSRIGISGSYRYMTGTDVRSDTGLLQVARKTVAEDLSALSANPLAAPIKWFEVKPGTSDVYYYAGTKIYKEAAGVHSMVRSLSSGTPEGEGLCDFDEYLYYRWDDKLGRFDYSSTWSDSWQTGLQVATFSPMRRFKNFLLVGHGRYVGTVDDLGAWDADRITLPPGYTVRDIFTVGSFAVILAIRGTSISESDEGMAFLWNGTTETYSDFFPIDGNPHAGIANKNKLIIIAGTQPVIIESLGGIGQMMKRIPRVERGYTAEVWPGAIELFDSMVHFGISDGTDTDVIRAVYNWGTRNPLLPADILVPEYPISTGDVEGTDVQITALKKVGTTLYIGWKDDSNYGIDTIDFTQYLASATVRTLAYDRESIFDKIPSKVVVDLKEPLKTDESVIVKISTDPYGDPTFADSDTTESTTVTAVDTKMIELPLENATNQLRGKDLHIEVTIGGTGSTRPAVKRIYAPFTEDNDTI